MDLIKYRNNTSRKIMEPIETQRSQTGTVTAYTKNLPRLTVTDVSLLHPFDNETDVVELLQSTHSRDS